MLPFHLVRASVIILVVGGKPPADDYGRPFLQMFLGSNSKSNQTTRMKQLIGANIGVTWRKKKRLRRNWRLHPAVLSDLSNKKVMNSGSICNPSSNEIIKENVTGIGEVSSTQRKHGTSPVSNRAMQDSYSKVTKGDACQDDLFTRLLGNGGNDPIRQLENCTDTFQKLLELEQKQQKLTLYLVDKFGVMEL
ncbi:hypothetical protein FRX31_004731 [Thalictrum thalictroides]|uniref:Uncharacterized protein n=1 Tax=Thalictrum thalictroides TaxID=46969 RepID=A0A7J6X7T6_THATH|nr:hypothetical protein FRX31_004731 [Thalictrum thalictroides]